MRPFIELDGLDRPAWLEARRHGIGSSDAPAICGLDRFASPFSVWCDKRGLVNEEDDNAAMEWGRLLEDPISKKFAGDTGLVVSAPTAMYQHDEHDFALASPDRWVHLGCDEPPLALLEIKTSALRDDWRDGPPERTHVQVQHQLAVTGLDHGHIACLLDGRKYDTWRVERDDELIKILMDIEAEFWDRVVNDNPPPTDGHRSTTEALHELYARTQPGSTIELPDHTRNLIVEHHLASQMERDAKADKAALSNEIKALLGEYEIGTLDGDIAVTWKASKAKDHVHNCPDCPHVPDGPPSRVFLPKKVSVA